MRYILLLGVMMGVTWGRPSDFQVSTIKPPTRTQPTPVLIKDFGNLRIHVSEKSEGDYGLEVYQQEEGGTRHKISSTVWTLPGDWRPPGLEKSRIVHAEVLSTGDVVVAFFSLENGLDLILLPKELFVREETESGIIVFPKLDVPWHPTVTTPSKHWEWSSSTTTTTTPYYPPYPAVE